MTLPVTGCATASSEFITIYKPRLICADIAVWQPKEQAALGAVFDKAAPALSDEQKATVKAINELLSLREGARECNKQQKNLEQGDK